MLTKRGMETVAVVLATAVFIMLSVTAIMWARSFTKEHTESTTKYIEGRMQCNEVLIVTNNDCNNLEIENKGAINVEKLLVRINDQTSDDSNRLIVGKTITLNIPGGTKKIEILPIIKVGKDFASCSAKKLVIECQE